MADNRFTRYYHKLFAGNATSSPTGITGIFGSDKTGAKIYTSNPETIQSYNAWVQGWVGAIKAGTKSPAMEDMNSVLFNLSYQLCYLLQAGVPEWNAATTYHQFQFCSAGGKLYISKQNTNIAHAVTETSWWQEYGANGGPGTAKAWVNFVGTGGNGACVINDSYNIESVIKTATGVYTIKFLTPMANGNYAWAGSVGGNNDGAWAQGDDNHLCGACPGVTSIKSATELRVLNYDRGDKVPQDGSNISVLVFST